MRRRYVFHQPRAGQRRYEPMPDPAGVFMHGQEWSKEWVELNAIEIMDGFDELPRPVRDAINYAPTPEKGAAATHQLVAEILRRGRR